MTDDVMKLDFDPKEIDQLLDFILEECPEIIFNVLKHQTCKPRKKKKNKPKKKAEPIVLDQSSRCASVEVLTRNAFYNSFSLPRSTSKTPFNVPSFSSFHGIPSNINVSISFEKKCLFDHQLKNRSLDNLAKCTCFFNTFNDYKKPSKVHFGRPLFLNCNQEPNNKINKTEKNIKANSNLNGISIDNKEAKRIIDDGLKERVLKQANVKSIHFNGGASKQTLSEFQPVEFLAKQAEQHANSIPFIKHPVLCNNEEQAYIVKKRHDFEETKDIIKEVESKTVGTYTIIESVEEDGFASANSINSRSNVKPKENDILEFNYSLKNDNEGTYKIEGAENKDINFVCVSAKVPAALKSAKQTKWVSSPVIVPGSIENIRFYCLENVHEDTKVNVIEGVSSLKNKTKDKSRSSKKNSVNELKVEQKKRRGSRSSSRSVEKMKCDNGVVSEQGSVTSSVLMWRELEEELQKLNEMVEEERMDEKKERKQIKCRNETTKQSSASLISRTSKNDARRSSPRRRDRSSSKAGKSAKADDVSMDFIESEADSLSMRSSVRTGNYFSEEEETLRRARKLQKKPPISNDGSFLIQKPPYPRSHSAKVIQLAGPHDSLERKMRSQKYLDNAISEVSDKETKKRWKATDSDGESAASLFCGGGLDLLKELKKIEVLRKAPLKGRLQRRKDVKQVGTSYDSESCSSRLSKDSSTIKSIDIALDQYLNEQSADKEFDYGKFMLCAGKDEYLPSEKEAGAFVWYRRNASKSEAIEYLRHKPVGSFLIRDSNSFPGAYGLVLKIETPSDPIHNTTETQSIRNFLIESTKEGGVRVKGSPLEPVFPDLKSLVNKHSHKRMSLPCKLILPRIDSSIPEMGKRRHFSVSSSPGLSCSVLYLSSENVEALAENTAISRATQCLLDRSGRRQGKGTTVCDLHVSKEGLILTDTCRKLFFRRHYALESITFAAIHEDDAKWTWTDQSNNKTISRIFGILCRSSENQYNHVCHLFAELDFPASEIVGKINQLLENMDL